MIVWLYLSTCSLALRWYDGVCFFATSSNSHTCANSWLSKLKFIYHCPYHRFSDCFDNDSASTHLVNWSTITKYTHSPPPNGPIMLTWIFSMGAHAVDIANGAFILHPPLFLTQLRKPITNVSISPVITGPKKWCVFFLFCFFSDVKCPSNTFSWPRVLINSLNPLHF